MTPLAAHVLAQPGVRWTDVARWDDDRWVSDHPLVVAALRSPFLNHVVAQTGWEAIPVPDHRRFLIQLRILNSGHQAAYVESRERVLFEVYRVPTRLIWSLEAS